MNDKDKTTEKAVSENHAAIGKFIRDNMLNGKTAEYARIAFGLGYKLSQNQPIASESVEQAAERYAKGEFEKDDDDNFHTHILEYSRLITPHFIAGAKWQAQQHTANTDLDKVREKLDLIRQDDDYGTKDWVEGWNSCLDCVHRLIDNIKK